MLSVLYKKAVLYMWVQNPLEIPVTLYIFKSKVACWRPAILLKLASLTGNFKGFWAQIQNSFKFKKRFLKNTFFAEHFALIFLSFNSFTKVLRVFRFYFYILLQASVTHCMLFPLTLKKTRLGIYVYIWLPRISACVLKHKQTWPEEAVYAYVG